MELSSGFEPVDPNPSPSSIVARPELAAVILAKFTPKERAVVELWQQKLSWDEIGPH